MQNEKPSDEGRPKAPPAEGIKEERDTGAPSRSWLYEIPIFYFLLAALQRFLFKEHPGFVDVQPSPFWLGILLFGLRYGMTAGLLSGMVSAALHSWGVLERSEGFLFQDADFYLGPGLFAAVGAGVGAAADGYAIRIEGLKARILGLYESVSGLQRQLQAEQKVLRAVEQQVVTQMSSLVTLYHGSKTLGTLDRGELFPAMLRFFADALKARKASLYVMDDGAWSLLTQLGWEEGDAYPTRVEPGQGVIGRAAAELRVVSAKDLFVAEGEAPRPGGSDAILAAPVLAPSGLPIAVFAVQAMEFMRFNTASLNLLALLSEWGSDSVAKCEMVEELRSRSVFDEEFAVHSKVFFEIQFGREFSRSLRYSLPFSLLLVGFERGAEPPAEKSSAGLRVISRVLRETVRNTDAVARTPIPEAPFAVLMPTTTRESAEAAKTRILDGLRKIGLEFPVRVGVGSYQAHMKGKEEVVEQAKAELR